MGTNTSTQTKKMNSYLATTLTLLLILELGSCGHYYYKRPSKSVFNSLVSDSRFSTLVAAVTAAGLTEEDEESEKFERLTKVDEDVWERNELFYDLKNIKIGVWYQWNQGRLQIINDRNTTEPLNQKLKTEGLIDDLDDLGS